MKDLQIANSWAEALNQQLELRVRERTTELQQSNARLRAEIEHREQMEEELLRVRNLESLGVLAGGIAHDFNNFLTVVQGNIELAKMQLGPDSAVQEILEDSAAACQRAAFLSSQLLTFAKGGAPVRRVVSIAKLIMDAVHLARAGSPDQHRCRNCWRISGLPKLMPAKSVRFSIICSSMQSRRCPKVESWKFARII